MTPDNLICGASLKMFFVALDLRILETGKRRGGVMMIWDIPDGQVRHKARLSSQSEAETDIN